MAGFCLYYPEIDLAEEQGSGLCLNWVAGASDALRQRGQQLAVLFPWKCGEDLLRSAGEEAKETEGATGRLKLGPDRRPALLRK